jgi:glycosyltransferase involved in cell wall biosynthesis
MKLVIISPCYNAQKNLDQLVQSIELQNDKRWELILVDDMSSDQTSRVMKMLSENNEKIKYIKNTEKKYALKNIVDVAREYQENEDVVIGVIDGDDSLCNPETVGLILSEYHTGADVVWTGHRWDINNMNISKNMPANVNPYQWEWCSSHFRTFRATMLKNISNRNFVGHSGKWFKRGYDQALMLPLLYNTKKRRYINEICYLYNIDSVSMPDRNWTERDQISTINFVRARGFIKDENTI